MDEADIVIGHNGDRFDLRKLRWRFISQDMAPPSPFRVLDTLKIARREFFAPSYKQDFLTKYFDLENKLSTDFQLWVDCEAGNKNRLEEMVEYNRHDVMGLEELYLKIRPYIRNHPNLGVLSLDDKEIILADIPGLIEGSHKGVGLGDKFLRHIERCNTLTNYTFRFEV